jgi:dCTP deaminase
MILSQTDLRALTASGEIGFSPELEEKQWGEASVDLRLGHSFTIIQPQDSIIISVANGLGAIGNTNLWKTQDLTSPDELGRRKNFILHPNEFVLALTHEEVRVPKNLIALVEGRSTYARMGLSMHQTAPWIQPGWCGRITLEIRNSGPLRIELTPLVDRPCQLTFFELKSDVPPEALYGSRSTDAYQNQQHPLVHKKTG